MLYLAMTDFPHKNIRHPIYLAEWRKRHSGLTQGGMADRLGIAQSLYSNVEGGSRRANLDQLVEIAKILDVEPWQLFLHPEDPFNEVASLYKQVPEDGRETATELLRAFVQKKLKST